MARTIDEFLKQTGDNKAQNERVYEKIIKLTEYIKGNYYKELTEKRLLTMPVRNITGEDTRSGTPLFDVTIIKERLFEKLQNDEDFRYKYGEDATYEYMIDKEMMNAEALSEITPTVIVKRKNLHYTYVAEAMAYSIPLFKHFQKELNLY